MFVGPESPGRELIDSQVCRCLEIQVHWQIIFKLDTNPNWGEVVDNLISHYIGLDPTPPGAGYSEEKIPIETRLLIKGMICGHCVSAVKKALASVAGVAKFVKMSRDWDEVLVQGEAEPEKLIDSVAWKGYEAKVA